MVAAGWRDVRSDCFKRGLNPLFLGVQFAQPSHMRRDFFKYRRMLILRKALHMAEGGDDLDQFYPFLFQLFQIPQHRVCPVDLRFKRPARKKVQVNKI